LGTPLARTVGIPRSAKLLQRPTVNGWLDRSRHGGNYELDGAIILEALDWTGLLYCGSLYSSLNRIVAAASTAVVSEMGEPLCHALLCKGLGGEHFVEDENNVDLNDVI
jgi:hypothetical protein